ncbi:unnamed protein product [Alopecurus aequalis]
MGGPNRRWQTKRHHDGPSNPRPRPPRYPGYNHANNQCPVPLWEREFCRYVGGGISWQKFCENKQSAYMYIHIEQWDDSGALENFQKIKSRFWSNYHAQPSDIPLPDPDLYIEKVDHSCEVDPELVADLDKAKLPFEANNEFALAANNKSQNQSGNWDVYLEKSVEVNKWEEEYSKSNMGLGPALNSSGWGDALNSSGWGDALVQPSWGSSSNNHCAANDWNNYHGASNSTYQDQRNAYGRKRNNKSRNQAENYQRGRWQDHSGRNHERFPFDNRQNGQRVERDF